MTGAPAELLRCSRIVTDRFCVECGANLYGRAVVREPHHELPIVTCSRCAAITVVQADGPIDRWAARWGGLALALWFLLVAALTVASVAAIAGPSIATAEFARDPLAEAIRLRYAAALEAAPNEKIEFAAWWAGQDPDALFAANGGWVGAIDFNAFWLWLPLGGGVFTAGVLASILMPAGRGRAAWAWFLLVAALLGVILGLVVLTWHFEGRMWYSAQATRMVGSPIAFVSAAFGLASLATGRRLGRPLLRAVAGLVLADGPRARLAGLWTIDGLPVPRPRGARR